MDASNVAELGPAAPVVTFDFTVGEPALQVKRHCYSWLSGVVLAAPPRNFLAFTLNY